MNGVTVLSAGVICLLSTGCWAANSDAKAEAAANEFSEAAEACLLDVRDKRIPYSKSGNCTNRLDRTSATYINLPGIKLTYDGNVIPKHAYIAAEAKAVAWSAAALSNGMLRKIEPVFSLW